MRGFIAAGLLAGCTGRQPARSNWISVEKPPIRVIMVSQEPFNKSSVTNLLKQVNRYPFKAYNFNDTIRVEVMSNSNRSDVDTKVRDIEVGK